MASDKRGTVLVTGGTGKVGSCVSVMLDAASVPFLVASRSPSPSARNVKFDWLDRTTWDDPFEDALVSAVFIVADVDALVRKVKISSAPPDISDIVWQFAIDEPPVFDSSTIMNDFVDHARKKYGVRRHVLLGATAVEPGGPAMGGTAKYLAELGRRGEIEWAVLRCTWFQENWSEQDNLLKSIRAEGKCYSASGSGKIPWVSKLDIAACAYHALTAEKSVDGDLFVLGPELLSYKDCADILTEVTGRKIAHVDLSSQDLALRLSRELGLPEDYAKGLAGMDLMIRHGGEEKTNDVVLSVTGKSPRTFREFVEENKKVWI